MLHKNHCIGSLKSRKTRFIVCFVTASLRICKGSGDKITVSGHSKAELPNLVGFVKLQPGLGEFVKNLVTNSIILGRLAS